MKNIGLAAMMVALLSVGGCPCGGAHTITGHRAAGQRETAEVGETVEFVDRKGRKYTRDFRGTVRRVK